ncbi:hypothetical protein [Novipirellula artificiosorum]|uniref:hypothetical protein n=1 Tax=Novipirellula artificiosorum TaxID=2528016 RepID=UPI0011B55BC0|nr:hypothetical protein [Novipirellula artificiosorum]
MRRCASTLGYGIEPLCGNEHLFVSMRQYGIESCRCHACGIASMRQYGIEPRRSTERGFASTLDGGTQLCRGNDTRDSLRQRRFIPEPGIATRRSR